MARVVTEEQALRRGTAQFIASDPTAVALRRTERQSDGAGGWTGEQEQTLPPQVVKLQPFTRLGAPERTSQAGTVYVPSHNMIGMPDLDAKAGDLFTWNGTRWRVMFVDDTVGYRISVEVVRDGD